MIRRPISAAHAALLPLFALTLPAQEAPNPAHAQQLRAAIDKTRKLESLSFKTTESQDAAMTRGTPIPREDKTVAGTWRYGLLQATIGDDGDEVLFANGRMVARRDRGDWQLRRNCLGNGQPLPFVVDPSVVLTLLDHLSDVQLTVARQEPGRHRDRDVLVYSLTLTGKLADQLLQSGLLPPSSGSAVMIFGGIGRMEMPRPEVTIDLAIYVDPASNHIQRIHSKTYSKGNGMGGVVVRMAGPGGVEVENEDEADDAADNPDPKAPLEYQKGLPKRRLDKQTSLTEFDLVLGDHGTVKPTTISTEVKQLLDLR